MAAKPHLRRRRWLDARSITDLPAPGRSTVRGLKLRARAPLPRAHLPQAAQPLSSPRLPLQAIDLRWE